MKKILIVDDENEIRELIKEKLEKSEYATMTAASGQDAINACSQDKPDLILVDIAMPLMDGYQTCSKLKQDDSTKNIPILFLTGKDLDPHGIAERCRTLGASGGISKMSSLKELLDKIKEVIG